MFGIKILKDNERRFLGKSGKPSLYKTRDAAQKAATKLDKKYEAKVLPSMLIHEID